jgi:kynurenine formamidase
MLKEELGRLIDLSLPIYHEMPIWSGEPKIGVVDYFKMGRQAGDQEIMNMKLLLCAVMRGRIPTLPTT